MRRVKDDLHLPIVQVGTRSFSKEEAEVVRVGKMRPIYAHSIDPLDSSWMSTVVDRLPDTVYLTVDLDSLDPSVLPGTGTPEPGGLSYRQLIALIKIVGQSKRIVAADINELVKLEGSSVSEFTAARIAAKIFVYCSGAL
jgi:agmatinase